MTDVCPGCGGIADNGHDRSDPPNVYLCSECSRNEQKVLNYLAADVFKRERKARRAELVKEFMLAWIADGDDVPHETILERAVKSADAFLKWEAEQ